MSTPISDGLHTSNDLLRRLMAKHGAAALNDQMVARNAGDARRVENSPAADTEADLFASGRQSS
jgi:hypothetical protein